jgi:hypothetical protein
VSWLSCAENDLVCPRLSGFPGQFDEAVDVTDTRNGPKNPGPLRALHWR